MLPIGLVFDSSQAFTRGVLRGVEQYAQRRPRWVLFFHDVCGLTPKVLSQIRPAGIIAHVVNDELVDIFRSRRKPVVNTSYMVPDAPFPRVGVDNRAVGRLAFRHLHERGFRNFALVGHRGHRYSEEREEGFLEELDPRRETYAAFYRKRDRHASSQAAPIDGTAQLHRWLKALPKPVGIFTCRGVWGVQVIEACRLTRFRVPDDVGVVCVDDDDMLCELSRPSLSSILVPSERIGFEAAALLDRLLEEHHSHDAPHTHAPLSAESSSPNARRGSRTDGRTDRSRRNRFRRHEVRLVQPTHFIARQSTEVYAGATPELAAAIRYIRGRAHRPIRVDDVALAVSVSRRVLEKQFRAHLQRGIGEEIRRVRLERARQLLTTSDLTISEVALQAGFSSVYYLSRVFRQATGETPSTFRHRLRYSVM